MEILVKIKYGSHLYGTATPSSDLDIKGIYIPCAQDILLQRIKPAASQTIPKPFGVKNTSNDIDYELYSPEKYLSLLAQGQSVALEMLFAPADAMLTHPHQKWADIKALAPRILTKKSASFVNYCRQQAIKYCLKGSRLAATRLVFEVLIASESQYGGSAKLSCALEDLKQLTRKSEFIALGGDAESLYFEVCGKKSLLNASIKSARLIIQKIIDGYGDRALAAESSNGADWKALSHAVRVAYQAIEFLKYHHMTFPRPEAAHLIEIKQGKIDFHLVVEEIGQLMIDLESAAQQSTLPDAYDQSVIDDFIKQLYFEQILKERRA
jgi:hypothetical protein